MRLTRKAWNNVIIIAVLLMIFTLQFSHQWFNPSSAPARHLTILPPDAVVLSINLGDNKVERIGENWRIQPPRQLSSEQLAAWVLRWQQLALAPYPAEQGIPVSVQQLSAQVWLAGEPAAVTVYFYWLDDERILVRNSSGDLLTLASDHLALLLPF